MRLPLALALAALLAACKPGGPDSPEDAYRAFVKNAANLPSAQLLAAFDAPTRAKLTERAHAAAQSTAGLPDDPATQLALSAGTPAELTEVKVLQSSSDAATLQVSTRSGPPAQVKMVREDGRWRIHLDSLDAPPPPATALDAGTSADAGAALDAGKP